MESSKHLGVSREAYDAKKVPGNFTTKEFLFEVVETYDNNLKMIVTRFYGKRKRILNN